MTATTLTPAQINEAADKFQATGLGWYDPANKAFASQFGYYDSNAIHAEVARRERVAAIEAFDTTPAIKAMLLASVAQRGAQKPEAVDYRSFAKAAAKTTSQYHKPRAAWKPEGGCALRMKLSKAVRFSYTQDSYADYSSVAVPVEGDISASDIAVCSRNVASFFRMADTHTGLAGSGCNYEAALKVTELGAFVVVTCRASIMD